ncbi:MAG: alpha-1,2-fucosyltransferase [Termitinemataceae bacterium]|nr:MAG: alpha-1,2-fucosyltransferase [Termitinemataceae bacterium]
MRISDAKSKQNYRQNVITFYFRGGIGNQLFQYAMYMELTRKFPNHEFKADLSANESEEYKEIPMYSYSLKNVFNIELPTISPQECRVEKKTLQEISCTKKRIKKIILALNNIAFINKIIINAYNFYSKIYYAYKKIFCNVIIELNYAYNKNVFLLDNNKNYSFMGIWMNEKYGRNINEELKRLLVSGLNPVLNNDDKLLLDEINNSVSICLHIRCYKIIDHNVSEIIDLDTLDVCNFPYYKRAIEIMDERLKERNISGHRYFIFSPVPEICKAEFSFIDNATFISHDDCKIDMLLMSKCKHAIIANSTFSYWAINMTDTKDKIVVSPKYLIISPFKKTEFYVPDRWIKVDNSVYK